MRHADDNVFQTCELAYVIGHVNAHSHLWKFATQMFVCREFTVSEFRIMKQLESRA